jgi:hypothetical protein
MVGERFWTTGIVLKYHGVDKWQIYLNFTDDGFCDDDAVDGKLTLRYLVALESGLDTLIKDAGKLGIEFRVKHLYIYADGEDKAYPPPIAPKDWRELLREQAARLGGDWQSAYDND